MAKSSSGKANSIGSIPSITIVNDENFTKMVSILNFYSITDKSGQQANWLSRQFPKQTYFTISLIAHNKEVLCNTPPPPPNLKKNYICF